MRRRRAVGLFALSAMVASPLALLSPSAAHAAPSPDLVLSQVYGGGGNADALYTHDFVELFNRGSAPASTDGLSVQYASAAGTGNFAVGASLPSRSVPAGGYLLVQMGAGNGNGAPLPTPDVTGTSSMSGTAGKVVLATGTTSLGCNGGSAACTPEQLARIVDLVGYGTANFFEGAAAAPGLSNTTAALRQQAGAQDTDQNGADFVAGPPAPRNSSATTGPPPEPEPDPQTDQCLVPAEQRTRVSSVQGTGAATPIPGQAVVTRGVVTSDLTSGGASGVPANQGSRGFYLEAPAEDRDADPQTSEGVFVFDEAGAFAGSVGALVAVAGTAGESFGQTQITATDIDVCETGPLALPAPAALPLPVAPAERGTRLEPLEGMRVTHPELTVVEHYQLERYGEVQLSTSGVLDNPTNVVDPRDDAAYEQVVAGNAASTIVLDDGRTGQNLDPLPYVVPGDTLRVGDQLRGATTVLGFGFGSYRLQPVDVQALTEQLRTHRTRPRPQTPPAVGGDLTVASFNVLNYFDGDGQGGGFPTSRGAVTQAELERQTAKLVAALKALDADVVGLMEIENDGGEFQASRTLVEALNAAYGSPVYGFVDTGVIGTDAIKQAFLYKTATVRPTGPHALLDASVDQRFDDGRNRPVLAQTFTELASGEAVTVAVNHLKSKGSSCGPGDDDPRQGNCNGTRTLAAAALVDWLKTGPTDQQDVGTLVIGDLNAYAKEDPISTVLEGGYVDLLAQAGESGYTYTFDGTQGRLDHALADGALAPLVTGADAWHINADEVPALDYKQSTGGVSSNQRFRTARTAELYFRPDAFRSSDHDPVVVGLQLAEPEVDAVPVQVLTVNDFHGHLEPTSSDPGAARLAGAVDALRAERPGGTVFASAGDDVGASPFVSAVADDEPTIDALNAMGLQVGAVGNHEFDKGFADLRDRIAPRTDWPNLGANVAGSGLPGHHVITTADGVRLGFIGVVTAQTASLVSPAGIEGITFTDPVEAIDREAALLTDGDPGNGEADVLVVLAHEGAARSATTPTDCASLAAADDAFGRIVRGSSPQVDAIFGGHTHVPVSCTFPNPGGKGVRAVLEGGEYGQRISQLRLTYVKSTDTVTDVQTAVLPVTAAAFPAVDAEVDAIVKAAQARAAELGRPVVGRLSGDLTRARTATGSEDRGAESTLGNFVADVQLEGANVNGRGPADIAFMNPGGLRTDLLVANQYGGEAPGEITYGEAAAVQPFANTLFTLDLSPDQIKRVLEQQWQPAGASRPFLALGVSRGFFFRYDPERPVGDRVIEITLDGEPLQDRTYRVVVNSFLASGGDNFTALREGLNRTDTGLNDLEVLVAHLQRGSLGAGTSPISPEGLTPRRALGPAPQPVDRAPVADAGGPYAVQVGQDGRLDASRSTDPDGGALTFAWDLDGDGAFDDATGATTVFGKGRPPGRYTVAVEVADGALTSTATAVVEVITPGTGNGGRPPGRG